MNNDDDIKRMPINELREEEGAHELATSPDMEPYLRLIMAGMQDHDTAPLMEEILNCRLRSDTPGDRESASNSHSAMPFSMSCTVHSTNRSR
jgi:hypothetical protein